MNGDVPASACSKVPAGGPPVPSDGRPGAGDANPLPRGIRAAIRDDIFCAKCDYNLRGLTSDRCPECGQALDAAEVMEQSLPWHRRQSLGLAWAFWLTVWEATFRPNRLCCRVARPVPYRDAQKFRWLVILHAHLPLAAVIGTFWWMCEFGPDGSGANGLDAAQVLVGANIASIVALAVVTGVPSYFCHPRRIPVERQNRTIALSYYATGPLAWVSLLALGALCLWPAIGRAVTALPPMPLPVSLIWAFLLAFLLVGPLVAWVNALTALFVIAFGRDRTRAGTVGLLAFATAIGAGVPGLYAVLFLVEFLRIVFYSFWP